MSQDINHQFATAKFLLGTKDLEIETQRQLIAQTQQEVHRLRERVMELENRLRNETESDPEQNPESP
jgi:BMFP domain-containing protein YqiC